MTLSTKSKILVAKLLHRIVRAFRRAAGKPMQGTFIRRGIRWQLDLDEGIDLMIYLAGAFEPTTVRAYRRQVRPGDVVLDIGANLGAHTLQFAKLVGAGGRVHAFEPTLKMLEKLQRNCALNPDLGSRVIINHAFCTFSGEERIPDRVYSSWPLVGSTAELHPAHCGKLNTVGTPRLVVLDEYVEVNRLARVDFFKLDVDGNEMAVLRGARMVLARFKPTILTEIAPYLARENNEDFGEIFEIFKEHGYRMRLLNSKKEIPLGPDYFIQHLPEHASINVLLS